MFFPSDFQKNTDVCDRHLGETACWRGVFVNRNFPFIIETNLEWIIAESEGARNDDD